jgi:ureidoacrylate peracid hydrolase
MSGREIPVVPSKTALLFVDVQNYNCSRSGGEYKDMDAVQFEERFGNFFEVLEATGIPNMKQVQSKAREKKIEIMFTVIESMTLDGRDRSLDYKVEKIRFVLFSF